MYTTLLEYSDRFSGVVRWATKWKDSIQAVLLSLLGFSSVFSMWNMGLSPSSWVVVSLNLWCACLVLRGWTRMDLWEKRIFLWSMISILSFIHFLLMDPEFKGWESVYHFCGKDMEYCTTSYRWNLTGWRKAMSLWNFTLSSALGAQRLLIEAGFGGLLPGEEAIPRECFVSIVWRLVPFWLNKWESNFGAECSSILFELPHFALELLIILPMVQIMAGRMRVLANPQMRGPRAVRRGADLDNIVPDVMQCTWVVDVSQRQFWSRLRKNRWPLVLISGITILAAANALCMPLYLEYTAIAADQSKGFVEYEAEITHVWGAKGNFSDEELFRNESLDGMLILHENTTVHSCVVDGASCGTDMQRGIVTWMMKESIVQYNESSHHVSMNSSYLVLSPAWAVGSLETSVKDESTVSSERLAHVIFGGYFANTTSKDDVSFVSLQQQYMNKVQRNRYVYGRNHIVDYFLGKPPADAARFYRIALKHVRELSRMASAEHKNLVPLIEGALAIMRLSCERWFSLLAVYASFIMFRDPPPHVREYIKFVAKTCRIFQQTILMSFPAVCWGYGAGFVFSAFASVVFWAGPMIRLIERIKKVATEVRPMHWHPATWEEVERMGKNCAICWGEIATHEANEEPERDSQAMGLSCGHAYHRKCLLEWLHSCYGQSRSATCPMCQSQVPLHVKYKLEFPWRLQVPQDGGTEDNHPPQRQEGIPGLVALAGQMPEEFIGRFEVPVGNVAFADENDHDDDHGQEALPMMEASTSGGEYSDDGGATRNENRFYVFRFDGRDTNRPSTSAVESSAVHELPGTSGIQPSAEALIIDDQQQTSSSIHLPDKEVVTPMDMDNEEDDIVSDPSLPQRDEGEEPQNTNKRGLQGIYARLRPRRHRHT